MAAPSTALAQALGGPPGHRGAAAPSRPEPQAVVREVQNGDGETMALVLPGGAAVAIAGAGVTGGQRRRAGRLA